MTTPNDLNHLDPGIAETVWLLRSCGFDTTDSGDGVSKPPDERSMDFPHVAAVTTPATMCADADRMAVVLGEGWTVEASYSTEGRTAILLATREQRESVERMQTFRVGETVRVSVVRPMTEHYDTGNDISPETQTL